MEVEDFYKELGLEAVAEAATPTEIRKAYRSKALVLHPDKRPDDPKAAEEFNRLQKAYEVLTDEKARKAYDELLVLRRARVQKEGKQSAKRQKMMQDLRERERAFDVEQQQRRAEVATAERLKAEMARIRATRKGRPSMDDMKRSFPLEEDPSPLSQPASRPAEDRERTIKVSWVSGGYTASRLREIFSQFGEVEDVVVGPKKSSKKGNALLVMASKEAAVLATDMDCGDFSSPLSVVLVEEANKAKETRMHAPPQKQTLDQRDRSLPEAQSLVGSAYRSYEDLTLMKMRQAAERARLIKELQREDKA